MKTSLPPNAHVGPGIPGAEADTQTARSAWEEQARLLARIEAALARMDKGRYGLCVGCNGKIPLRHLKADPAAAACPECEKSEELAL